MTGVSTDISTSFVKSAGGEGDTLFCTGTVVGMGKYNLFKFRYTYGPLSRKDTGVHKNRL